MACGCPVIASNVLAIPEICDGAAILCNPYNYECFANAVLKILSDAQTRKDIIRKGLERARTFDWDTHIKMIVNVYKRTSIET